MQRYSEFSPTYFDRKGASLSDRQDWLVVPVMKTRDSAPLDVSNFEVALAELGDEGEDVEVHRFTHWGPGWFEIILVRDGTEAALKAYELEDALENYPVLDEHDWSDREYSTAFDYWFSCGLRDRMEICDRFGVSRFAARRGMEIPCAVDISYLAGEWG